MNDIYIKVEPQLGSAIDKVCRSAINLADQLKIPVKFTFNGITIFAEPGPAMTSHIRADLLSDRYQNSRS